MAYKLTNQALVQAKPQDLPYKLVDGHRLYVEVRPSGKKVFMWRYDYNGKENTFTIGEYGRLTLAEARKLRDDYDALRKQGIEPKQFVRDQKRQLIQEQTSTFEAVATEWFAAERTKIKPITAQAKWARLQKYVFPTLGQRPVKSIAPQEIIHLMRQIESVNTRGMPQRCLQVCNQVFKYAVKYKGVLSNPCYGVSDDLKKVTEQHHPYLPPEELPKFLQTLEQVATTDLTRLGLKLLILSFLRVGEVRKLQWAHVLWDAQELRLPAQIMKVPSNGGQTVPISKQLHAVLTELHALSGTNPHGYVLPTQNRQKNPIMSTANFARLLVRMGYKGKVVPHGFRTTISTILNEQHFHHDAIERQMHHKEADKVRDAYNRATYWPERVKMMQWWGDYVEGCAKLSNNNAALRKERA